MNKQEYTEPQIAIPHNYHTSSIIQSKQSAAEKAIAHLFTDGFAIPISVIGELPGYQPTHSKSKHLYTSIHHTDKRRASISPSIASMVHHLAPIPNHVIDYFIYTLEHILI